MFQGYTVLFVRASMATNVDKMRSVLSVMFVYHVAFVHALSTTGSSGMSVTSHCDGDSVGSK